MTPAQLQTNSIWSTITPPFLWWSLKLMFLGFNAYFRSNSGMELASTQLSVTLRRQSNKVTSLTAIAMTLMTLPSLYIESVRSSPELFASAYGLSPSFLQFPRVPSWHWHLLGCFTWIPIPCAGLYWPQEPHVMFHSFLSPFYPYFFSHCSLWTPST